uniref:Uncharacterized protein n=1 Tax=Anopheles farauti TaxID=69004 RepID=A0A182Q5Y9_9DIPT
MATKAVTHATEEQHDYVSRQKYDQLLDDYNKLKAKDESRSVSEPDQNVLASYLDRINRFEHLMKELQGDFLEMKTSMPI